MKDRLGFGGEIRLERMGENGRRRFGSFQNGRNSRHLEDIPR